MTNVYGYIRVSSRDQNEDRQMIALKEAGVARRDIFMDKRSGKDFNRPQYRRLLRKMKKDDLLYIKSIDRLGRNYEEIQQQWRLLTKEMGVDIVVLDMPLLDTRRGKDLMGTFLSDIVLQVLSFVAENERINIRQRQAEGIAAARAKGVDIVVLDMPLLDTRRGKDLMGTFLSDIVLQVLSFVAENERINIRQRQAEGIAAARAKGEPFGRPATPLPDNFSDVCRAWRARELTTKQAADACGMPTSTFFGKAKKLADAERAGRERT